MRTKTFFIFFAISFVLSLLMYYLHIRLISQTPIIPIKNIYIFHFILNLLVLLAVFFVSKTAFDKTGFAFMTMSVLKMLSAIVFLWPLFRSDQANLLPNVFNFFIPYFVFITLEIAFSIKLLNTPK